MSIIGALRSITNALDCFTTTGGSEFMLDDIADTNPMNTIKGSTIRTIPANSAAKNILKNCPIFFLCYVIYTIISCHPQA